MVEPAVMAIYDKFKPWTPYGGFPLFRASDWEVDNWHDSDHDTKSYVSRICASSGPLLNHIYRSRSRSAHLDPNQRLHGLRGSDISLIFFPRLSFTCLYYQPLPRNHASMNTSACSYSSHVRATRSSMSIPFNDRLVPNNT